jgi:cytochrome c-type biogenesis protein CcsB
VGDAVSAAAVDRGLELVSDRLLLAAVLVYSAAMLLYAAEWAFGGRGRVARTSARVEVARQCSPERVAVGAGAPVDREPSGPVEPPAVPSYVSGSHSRPVEPAGARAGRGSRADRAGRMALAVTVLGWALHGGSLTARGFAAGRVPWGNMYEFSSAIAFAATSAFLVLLWRQREFRYLGAFVLLPVVLGLGLAGTVLYAEAGPLVPALNSYWIVIHVTAAIVSFGVFTLAAVLGGLYLVRARYERQVAQGWAPAGGLGRLLPEAAVLDRTSYRLTAFAFPLWTFAIIAGAIWAEAAWGRYWGWDPKETWAFISWVVYAAYLHARATAGWKGTRAAAIGGIAFVTMLFNYFGVNIWISGLHSYAGVG